MKAGFPMKLWFRRCVAVLLFTALSSVALSQRAGRGQQQDEPDSVMPNGKSQKEEILKAEHQQNLKDAAVLADLAEQLKADLEKNDRYILSMSTLKKTDDIEKLVKRIRTRLRH
jgi:Tfp pilus assembly protein PilO